MSASRLECGSSSTHRPLASTPSTTNATRTTPNAPKTPPTRPHPTASTAGRSCSASVFTCPSCATTASRSELRVFTTSSAHWVHGGVAGKKLLLPLCRKVAEAVDGGKIEIWGDGEQTRSFLYIDECLEGVRRLVQSPFTGPVNIGSEEMVTINQLASIVMDIASKRLTVKHVPGPLGVRGRNSDNRLIREQHGWAPSRPLREGLERAYSWISAQVAAIARELVAR